MIKNFFKYAFYGAATTVGYMSVMKVADICKDPVKKANVKKRLVKIKNVFTD